MTLKDVLNGTPHDSLDCPCIEDGYILKYRHTQTNPPCSITAIVITGIEYVSTEIFSKHETVNIPEQIDGHPVKYIARNAFSYDSHMKKVIIPDSVEYIYNSAFMDSKVESVHVGANVSKICDSAFSSCVNLVDIILPEGLFDTGMNVFSNCVSLKHIRLPESLTLLDSGSFDGCKSLESIYLGENLRQIGQSYTREDFAYECHNLKNIVVSPLNKTFKVEKDILYNTEHKLLVKVFDSEKQTKITIPEWVEDISSCAFDSCKNLKTLIIPHKEIPSLSTSHIKTVGVVRCVPGSPVEKYFNSINVKTAPVNESKINDNLDDLTNTEKDI